MTPDFEELVGGPDLDDAHREQLFSAHEALLAAGPPAELPPSLAHAPRPEAEVVRLPSGRRRATYALVAAAALLAFSVGIAISHGSSNAFAASWTQAMHGTGPAQDAFASIAGTKTDEAGNWQMRLRVQGLPHLPGKQYYVLWLTLKGRPVAVCGTFNVKSGVTEAVFSEPYKVREYDGWVVTVWRGPKTGLGPVVMRTEKV